MRETPFIYVNTVDVTICNLPVSSIYLKSKHMQLQQLVQQLDCYIIRIRLYIKIKEIFSVSERKEQILLNDLSYSNF